MKNINLVSWLGLALFLLPVLSFADTQLTCGIAGRSNLAFEARGLWIERGMLTAAYTNGALSHGSYPVQASYDSQRGVYGYRFKARETTTMTSMPSGHRQEVTLLTTTYLEYNPNTKYSSLSITRKEIGFLPSIFGAGLSIEKEKFAVICAPGMMIPTDPLVKGQDD